MSRVYLPRSRGPARWRPGCLAFALGGLMVALAIFYAWYVNR